MEFNDETRLMSLPFLNIFRLRTALLVCFIGLTMFSGLTITFLTLRLSYTARINYTHEVGHLLTHSVTVKIDNFLQDVEDNVEFAERFLFKMKNEKVDYHLLFDNLAHSLIVNPNLGTFYYTEEKTGYTVKLAVREKPGFKFDSRDPTRLNQVSLYTEKDIVVEETIPNPSGTFTLKTYSYPDFPNKPLSIDENGGHDQRQKPWYILGKSIPIIEKGRWTNCYSFSKNTKGFRTGLVYATGLGDEKENLFAVLGIGVGTEWISDYLFEAMQEIHKRGVNSFIFEKLPDNTKMVLAHSLKEDVFPKDQEGDTNYYSLPKEMKDPAIEKMLLSLPEIPLNQSRLMSDFENIFYFDVNGSDYIGIIKTILPGTSPDWGLCLYVPEKVLFRNAYLHLYMAFSILVVVMIISIFLSFALARTASKPIEGLVLLAQKIGRLDFTHKSKADSKIIEIKDLAHSMSLMQIGLQAFTQYLPKEVLKSLFDAGIGASLGGKEKNVSIMFTDVVDFTRFSEILSPDDLVLQLNEYLGCFASVIIKNEGTVDKYIGDAIMAYWNAPRDCDDYAFKACKTVIQGLHNLSFLQKEWGRLHKPIFKVRIGINTGNVVLGNIGTKEHLSYTVMGDNVNLASRLEGLNKVYGTTIMISDVTLQACGGRVVTRPIDLVGVKGKDKKIMIHELLGLAGETSESIVRFCEEFKKAYEAYVKKEWPIALSLFLKLTSENPADKLCQIYADRCRDYHQNPPDDSWDGGQQMFQK